MLLHTVTEEIGHFETLATAVALNLSKAPTKLQEEGVKDSIVAAVIGNYPEGRWTSGPSIDSKGEFTVFPNRPLGDIPNLGPARPDSGAEQQQTG